MIPGAKTTLLDNDLADAIVARFMAGKAVEFEYAGVSAPGRGVQVQRVFLIPEPLFKDSGHGLLIVVGKAAFSWDGREGLNKFKLTTNGVKPLVLAEELSVLLHAVIDLLRQATNQTAYLTHQES